MRKIEEGLCVETDGDGHYYKIPMELKLEFTQWLEWGEEYWNPDSPNAYANDWQGTDFDSYRVNYCDIN